MAAYIKFDGIDGECLDKDHKKWIDLESAGHVLSRPRGGSTGVARARGDVIFEDLQCTKLLDKSSPKIAEAVAKGKVFSQSGNPVHDRDGGPGAHDLPGL